MRTALLSIGSIGTAALLVAIGAGPASAADTQAPKVVSLTVSSASVDTTDGPGAVTVTARVTDAGGSGVDAVTFDGQYTKDASAHPASVTTTSIGLSTLTDGSYQSPITLPRVSGTAADGTYSKTVTLGAGTRGVWALEVRATDGDDNALSLTTAQLAAAGLTSSVRSTTSKASAAPKLKGTTQFAFSPEFGIFGFFGYVTLTPPAATPSSNGYVLDSASKDCGVVQSAGGYATSSISFAKRNPPWPCTVKVRAVNAAGASPATTLTFI